MAVSIETLANLARGLGDVLFPPVCVQCRGLVDGGPYRHLCSDCASRLDFIRGACCETCGHPFVAIADGEGCPHCAALDPAFARNRAAVLFRGGARALLIELKYHRGLHVLGDMEAVFRAAPQVLSHVRGAVLVPVPLHPRKKRKRGFNQSERLASALSRAAGAGTRVVPLLRRIADTPSQTSLDRRTRQANLKNAFALEPGADLNPRLRHILVDDVFTTGSTLNSCARALRRAGCVNIEAATFAHG